MPQARERHTVVGLVLRQDGHVALLAGPRQRWHSQDGYTFIPMELPGGLMEQNESPADVAARLGMTSFGTPTRLVSSPRIYGPSAAHAIDVLPTGGEPEPLPLLRIMRLLPREPDDPTPPISVVRTYLITLDATLIQPGPATAGLLWLTPRALRNALRGMPLSELLDQPGARWQPASASALPADAFIFVPGDYGERHLVRVAAKYGDQALFGEVDG